jgi:hypothetical protein
MKFKRRLAVMLAFAMVMASGLTVGYAGAETDTVAQPAFSDIGGHWAEEAIRAAAALKIVSGYPDGTFRPDNLIKREEFYKLLANILTVTPDSSNTTIGFTDVAADGWYVPTIKIAVAGGITQGYGSGTFGIGLMISRQEAAKVCGSVISEEVNASAVGADTANDRASIADWAYDYVDLMFKKGYMRGDTAGDFRPKMALTRAEAATILLNIKKNETVIAANADSLLGSSCLKLHSGEVGAFTSGNGTKAKPYEIYTEAQLNHMRMHMTDGAFFILKKNIAITNDYAAVSPASVEASDWSIGNFEPIGSKVNPFEGSLDGNGFAISGLNIIASENQYGSLHTSYCAGLFGALAKNSTVKNLTVDASIIEGFECVGAVAGYNQGTIDNCTLGSKGIVSGSSDIGGIAGYSDSTVFNCRNEGSVSGENAGGIVGYSTGSIHGCYNTETVSAAAIGGGIAAHQGKGDGAITNCYNEGSVIAGDYSGGIVGENEASVSNCYNAGKVRGAGISGGIAGRNDGAVRTVYCAGVVTGEESSGSLIGQNVGSLETAFWLNNTNSAAVGLSGSTASQSAVARVTQQELSGQQGVTTQVGARMLIDLLNEKTENWKYLYNILSTDNTGNTIDPSDLASKYLYPVLISE